MLSFASFVFCYLFFVFSFSFFFSVSVSEAGSYKSTHDQLGKCEGEMEFPPAYTYRP